MFSNYLKSLFQLDTRSWQSDQGVGSLVTLFVAALLLFLSIFMGLILVMNVFDFDDLLKTFGLGFLILSDALNFGHVIILSITFIVSVAVAVVCIYLFNNQALHKVVRFYAWLCSICGFLVYMKVVANFYEGEFIFSQRFPRYLLAIGIITTAVYVLPLLFNRYDVRTFAMPVFVGNFIHLMVILWKNTISGKTIDLSAPVIYQAHRITRGVWDKFPEMKNITIDSSQTPHIYYFWGDIFVFILMVAIAIYFVINAPFFAGIKRRMDLRFASSD